MGLHNHQESAEMADPTPEPTPTPTDPPPTDPTPDPPKPTPGEPDDGKGSKDAVLADLAKERDKRQELEQKVTELTSAQQQQMDAIAKALGLKADEPPDPAVLAEQVTQEQAKAREASVQLAVYRNAAAHEANADALLDSASFLRSLAEVEPTDAAAVNAAIKAAVEANPLLKAAPPPTTPPFPGGPRSTPPTQAGSLGEAIAGRLTRTNR